MDSIELRNDFSSAEIIEQIRIEHQRGFGFVPFVGSGVSSASGILMGQQFTDYLGWTVYSSLRDDAPEDRRDIRTQGWPALPSHRDVEDAKAWISKKYEQIGKNWQVQFPNPPVLSNPSSGLAQLLFGIQRAMKPAILHTGFDASNSIAQEWIRFVRGRVPAGGYDIGVDAATTSEGRVIEQGIRSLYDWRATLHFLSSLVVERGLPSRDPTLQMHEPDPGIVDSFNIHITRGRRHNLAHKMIAHLSAPMRTRVFLTTNFDSLLEDSFREIGQTLTVFQVGTSDPMPDSVTVRAQNSLIKLHGGLLSTRADFSLDAEPDFRDYQMFEQYLFPAVGGRPAVGNHLLVLGFSGRDQRIIRLLRRVFENHDNFKVFWLCFNKHDLLQVSKLFPAGEYDRSRFITHVTDRGDLFLYELYQEMNGSLPPGGFSYQFVHNVPPRSLHTGSRESRYDDLRKALKQSIESKTIRDSVAQDMVAFESWTSLSRKADFNVSDYHRFAELQKFSKKFSERLAPLDADCGHSLILDGNSGLSSLIGDVYNELNQIGSNECVWLELEDNWQPRHVVNEMLQILALRRGRFQLEHVPLRARNREVWGLPVNHDWLCFDLFKKNFDRDRRYLSRILSSLRVSPSACYVFLYARNGPGGCAGLGDYEPNEKVGPKTELDIIFGQHKPRFWTSTPVQNAAYDDYTEFFFVRMLLKAVGFTLVYLPYSLRRFQYESKNDGGASEVLSQAGADYPSSVRRSMRLKLHNVDIVAEHVLHVQQRASENLPAKEPQRIEDLHLRPGALIRQPTFKDTLEKTWGWLSVGSSVDTLIATNKADSNQLSWEKMRFLFVCSLFRISRHPSALFSEAAFKCPKSYNTKGIDNDVLRQKQVRHWIRTFEQFGLFHRKPGGYSWKHRDLRETIYVALKSMMWTPGKWRVESGQHGEESGEDQQGYHTNLEQIESALHHAIGRWYFKAFCSTGHHLPFNECVYHYLQALIWQHKERLLRDCSLKGDDRTVRRLQRFASIVSELNGNIRIARKTISYWMQDDRGDGVFDVVNSFFYDPVNNTRPVLDGFLKSVDPKPLDPASKYSESDFERYSTYLQYLNDQLVKEMEQVHEDLSDAGRDSRIRGYSEFFPYSFVENKEHLEQLESRTSGDFHPSRIRLDHALKSVGELIFEQGQGATVKTLPHEQVELEAIYSDWILPQVQHWESRHEIDTSADSIWRQVLKTKLCKRSEQHEHPQRRTALLAIVGCWWRGRSIRVEAHQAALQRIVRLMNDTAYECVKLAKLQEASRDPLVQNVRYLQQKESPRKRHVPVSSHSSWLAVCASCLAASQYADELDVSLLPVQLEEQIRSLTMYGLALGRLRRFSEAHRRLDEALALISKSTSSRKVEEQAIARLRRSEIYLLQGQEAASPIEPEFWRQSPEPTTMEIRERFTTRSRAVQSYYDNAWNELEEAAALLSGDSRSGLWWGRLYALKLRVIAESEINKAADEVSPYRRYSFHPLCERSREDYRAKVRGIFDKALLIARGDAARTCRVICYYATFLIARYHPNRESSNLFSDTRNEALRELRELREELERSYRQHAELTVSVRLYGNPKATKSEAIGEHQDGAIKFNPSFVKFKNGVFEVKAEGFKRIEINFSQPVIEHAEIANAPQGIRVEFKPISIKAHADNPFRRKVSIQTRINDHVVGISRQSNARFSALADEELANYVRRTSAVLRENIDFFKKRVLRETYSRKDPTSTVFWRRLGRSENDLHQNWCGTSHANGDSNSVLGYDVRVRIETPTASLATLVRPLPQGPCQGVHTADAALQGVANMANNVTVSPGENAIFCYEGDTILDLAKLVGKLEKSVWNSENAVNQKSFDDLLNTLFFSGDKRILVYATDRLHTPSGIVYMRQTVDSEGAQNR